MEIYFYTYKGLLEDKITIKSIGTCMVIFIPRNIWEKQLICFSGRNFSGHKTYRFKPELVLQVEQTTVIDASFGLYGEM